MTVAVDIVVPTIGRDSLALLLASLDGPPDRLPDRVILVDDRRSPREPLPSGAISPELRARLHVVGGGGRGAAAARNLGWRASQAEWVTFLDDDVLPCRGWLTELERDVRTAATNVAGSRGCIRVPDDVHRRAGGEPRAANERATAAADVTYRTSALRRVGGFDERFVGAAREDDDLTLRLRAIGYRVVTGRRSAVHPVWPTSPWHRVWAQAGNADDALMRTLHGPGWRDAVAAPAGTFSRFVATTGAAVLAVAGVALGNPFLASGALLAWLAGTASVARRELAARPAIRTQVGATLASSVAIPAAAVWHRLMGELRAHGVRRRLRPGADVAPRGGHSVGAHS